MNTAKKHLYRVVLKDYPDVMDVKQVSSLLSVSTKTIYKLINDGKLSALKVGREFRVPKVVLMAYIKNFGSRVSVQPNL